ncbi:MAG: leucine-rich repeat domain-containing protein, partial [Algicola sp.]|nr:leucine-rich repeat domain-containing protein [Algicola sp.]
SNLAVLQLNNNLLSDITALFKLANTRRIDLAGNNGIACADLSALEATLGQAVVTRPAQCDGISPLISSINFADDVLATCVQAVAKTNGWTTADQITQLTCKAMNISDLKGIENLPWLTSLDLRQNQITDIAPLVNLTAVTQLKLTKNRLDDVTSLANLADLSFLSISNNQFGDAVFGELSSLTNLTKLYLRGSQVVDISTLADLQSLTHLYLRDNQIVDIAALSDLPSLAVLQLSNNLISDVSGLLIIDGIRRIDLASNNTIACADLDELDTALGESVVTRPAGCDGISPLISAIKFSDVALEACVQAAAAMNSWTSADEMTQLDCSAQGISDLRGIENLTALTTLDLSNNQISDIAPLVNLSGLTELELSDNLL